ncbi:terpene synthase family protein [Fluviispira multicolorata]|uniref:Terpene synthase n=1 Tax=Fluviispira multicolorata TaxID=2654512 RepID=A0A833JDX2_9BACT|nr:hypothetical protein [Fluviispira multicolorata]KAB8029095.1 hypothetical protein GCL57_11180 [Fluviispira multicolorata]
MKINTESLIRNAKDKLYYPFPLSVNPFVEAAEKSTLNWLKEYNLVKNQDDFNKAVALRAWGVVAYSYPNASFELLSLISDWINWIFLADDEYDEQALGKDPIQTSKVLDAYFNIICLRETDYQNNITLALKNLMERLRKVTDKNWLAQYQKSMSQYFEGCLKESFYRAAKEVPNVVDYLKLRLLSVGMYSFFDMIELTLSSDLPQYFKISPEYFLFRDMASNICAWANDIYSFPKEFRHGEPCNLLTSLMSHEVISFDKAFDKTVELHNQEISHFIELEKRVLLEVINESENQIVQEWINGLKNWMVGAWRWTLESGRYQVDLNDATNRVFFDDSSRESVPS